MTNDDRRSRLVFQILNKAGDVADQRRRALVRRYVKSGQATDCGRAHHGTFGSGNVCATGRSPEQVTRKATTRIDRWLASPAGKAIAAAAAKRISGSDAKMASIIHRLGGDDRHPAHVAAISKTALKVSRQVSAGDPEAEMVLFAQNLSLLKWATNAKHIKGAHSEFRLIPMGLLAYVLTSSAPDRFHTAKKARKVVQRTMKKISPVKGERADPESKSKDDDAPTRHQKTKPDDEGEALSKAAKRISRYGDYWHALLAAALGRSGGDLDLSVRIADHAFRGKSGRTPDEELSSPAVSEPARHARFARAGDPADCGHEREGGEFGEGNDCAVATGQERRSRPRRPSGKRPSGGVLASANIEENTTFEYAIKAIYSPAQKVARQQSEEIDRDAGLQAKTYNAVGDWSDGAENSIVSIYSKGISSLDQVSRVAAKKGLAWNQKAVIPFVFRRGGPDRIHQIDIKDSDLKSIRGRLDKAGIQFRSLIPGKSGTRIMIYDEGNGLSSNVTQFGEHYRGRITAKRFEAEGKFLGADTRTAARKVYRDLLAAKFRRHARLDDRRHRRNEGGRWNHRGSPARFAAKTQAGMIGDGFLVPPTSPIGDLTLVHLLARYGLTPIEGEVKGGAVCRRKGSKVVLDLRKLRAAQARGPSDQHSTSNPYHLIIREIGESLCPRPRVKQIPKAVATKVSPLATKSALDFVGECFAALAAGQQFEDDVLLLYKKCGGMHP